MKTLNIYSHTPKYVQDLMSLYGYPSQVGFGSAVFYEQIEDSSDLEKIALRYYKYFVGDLWNSFGENAWMTPWQEIYTRNTEQKPNIVAELNSITDIEISQLIPILLFSNSDNKEKAHKVLSANYDDPNVVNLRVYKIGDGGAMSGILIIGCRINGETTTLIFLLD